MRFMFLLLYLYTASLFAADEMNLVVDDQELQITRYPATGEQLSIWLLPRLGSAPTVRQMAQAVADRGTEVWLVDLTFSLFLPEGPASLRSIEGRYVSGLLAEARRSSGKSITLLAQGYAAIPALKGARQWQLDQQQTASPQRYLNGVVLLSPELYATIPALGMEPVYEDIVAATNVPIMIYQAGKRGNRWQLDKLVERLHKGGAQVFTRVLPGVTGLFYEKDKASPTLAERKRFPVHLDKAVSLLRRMPMPEQALAMDTLSEQRGLGLDTQLTPFRAGFSPAPVDLQAASGRRVTRDDYRGRVTVMNFWASWCPPCVEEIPSLNNLRRQMAGLPFELISVNYAEDEASIGAFLKRVKVDFPVLLDSDGSYAARWNVLVFPSTFVIGPDGRIAYGVNGAILWDSPQVVSELKALLPAADTSMSSR